MQTYIQEGFETKWKNNEKPPPNAPKSIPNRPKMVRKRSQEGQEIQQSSSRGPGRPQEADFPAIVLQPSANMEAKIEQKLQKNSIKNH